MTLPLRIGTRRSKLALTQSGMMQRAIGRAMGVAYADLAEAVPLVEIVTTGDRIQDRTLIEAGGKGLFTKEIDEAQLDGRAAFAVHSMKDVPTVLPKAGKDENGNPCLFIPDVEGYGQTVELLSNVKV